jgi:ribosomal protein S6
MRKYETIFILDPDLEEEQAQSAIEKVKGIITQTNGEILKVEDWGKRKLAYEVKKKSSSSNRFGWTSAKPQSQKAPFQRSPRRRSRRHKVGDDIL